MPSLRCAVLQSAALLWVRVLSDSTQAALLHAETTKSTPWGTPSYLVGVCNTVWTSAFAHYKLPYSVHFGDSGYYKWWSPLASGTDTEIGVGMLLSPPNTVYRTDGSWETHYFGANHFRPDASNSTNCCCEYVGGEGPDHPRVLADYFVAKVPHSSHRPMAEVCHPYLRECPTSNATAFQLFGKPFIEIYDTCRPVVAWPAYFKPLLFSLALVLFIAVGRLLQYCRSGRGKVVMEDDAESGAYHVMPEEAPPSFGAPDSCEEARQESQGSTVCSVSESVSMGCSSSFTQK